MARLDAYRFRGASRSVQSWRSRHGHGSRPRFQRRNRFSLCTHALARTQNGPRLDQPWIKRNIWTTCVQAQVGESFASTSICYDGVAPTGAGTSTVFSLGPAHDAKIFSVRVPDADHSRPHPTRARLLHTKQCAVVKSVRLLGRSEFHVAACVAR